MDISELQYRRYTGKIPVGTAVFDGFGEITVVNVLHGRMLVAEILAQFHLQQLNECGVADDSPIALGDAYEIWTNGNPNASAGHETATMMLERNATAIVFRMVQDAGEVLLYVNDLARMKTGFDLVTRRSDGMLVFTEIKGRSRQTSKPHFELLADTRHKGRQLSHSWIWRSFCEAGLFSGSASLFFRVLEDVVHHRYVRRLLLVSPATHDIIGVAYEDELCQLAALEEPGEQASAVVELEELLKAGIKATPDWLPR
ncbi:MAG: hypothetical protein ACRCWF_05930 [Beijerinckiaceae bacterium]